MDTKENLDNLDRVISGLNEAEQEYIKKTYPSLEPEKWHKRIRRKFIAIDIGGSGAFLMERSTGELLNIKAYGVPDYNKKKKANIGNIKTVNPAVLHTKRYNYLR